MQAPDRAVERRPHHRLGVGEPPPGPADLPQPVVGLVPGLREVLDQCPLERPGVAVCVPGGVPGLLERDHQLADDVELALQGGAVADPDRPGVGIAGQVRELELGDPPAAVDGVQDLEVRGVAGHRAQQPAPPQLGLVGVTGLDQRADRQRRVAQPAEAVVPIARPARVLGQRGRRRGHDAAGRGVGQHPQGHQGAAHQVGVGCVGPAPVGPVLVLGDGRVDPVVDRPEVTQRHVRRQPGRREGEDRALLHVELVGVPVVAGPRQPWSAQDQLVRAADGGDHGLSVDGLAPHPRQHRAVVQPDHPLVADPDRAADAVDAAYDVRAMVTGRHHVGQRHDTGRGGERGLQGRRLPDVAPADLELPDRAQLPVPVLVGAEQPGEAGRGAEPGQAEPVDGAVRADERRGLPVADQGVVRDREGHDARLARLANLTP